MRLWRTQPKSQKNKRTRRSRTEWKSRTRADAGVPERVSVSVLTNMASTMAACRQWIYRCAQRPRHLRLQGVPHRQADPLLDTGTDSEGINRLPLTNEGKCRRTTVPLKTVVRLRSREPSTDDGVPYDHDTRSAIAEHGTVYPVHHRLPLRNGLP